MTFTDPIYLLMIFPAVAWAVWIARGIHGMARMRRRIVVGLRILLLVLLILALSGAQNVRSNRGVATVYVLDKSASMDMYGDAAEGYIRKSMWRRPVRIDQVGFGRLRQGSCNLMSSTQPDSYPMG